MADWDVVAEELLRKVCSVDADVRFRSLVLQQQCEGLQDICHYFRSLETSLIQEKTAQQTETLAVEQSIQDAIQRARKVRAELAAGQREEEEEEEEEEEISGAEEQKLQSILAVAKATRAAHQSQETVEDKTETVPKVRLEYPRKLKVLETQLEDLDVKEREASTRFVFCCKMSEHLSMSSKRRQLLLQQTVGGAGRIDMPVARIQTSFPKQVWRLRGGYQRLMEFMLEKMEVESPKFRQVADTPTFSSVFPLYHRLKQAKKMLRLLNSEARDLLQRLPASPPKLSDAAAAHRDAMLARIRRRKPQPAVGVIDNDALRAAALKTRSPLQADVELLDKLQAAWAYEPTEDDAEKHPVGVYSTAVREVILTELSNAVLWSFKTHFTDTAEAPDAVQVQAVMRLIRLVDSVALSRGRVYRSVVAPS